jgi:hypothetical protein
MDEKLFFNSNQGISVMNYSIQNNKIFVPITDRVIGLDFICKLIHLINYIEIKYARIKIPIILHFQKVDVIDKLTIAFLESICNYIISNCNRAVKVDLNVSDRISSAGITSSILMLLTTGKKKHIDDFKIRYYFDQYKNHYRRIISGDEKKDSAILSDVYSEIDIFF